MRGWFSCCEKSNHTGTIQFWQILVGMSLPLQDSQWILSLDLYWLFFSMHFKSPVGGEDIWIYLRLNWKASFCRWSYCSLKALKQSHLITMVVSGLCFLLNLKKNEWSFFSDSSNYLPDKKFSDDTEVWKLGREAEVSITCSVVRAADGSEANITSPWWECFHLQEQLLLVATNTIYCKCGYFWAYFHSRQLLLRSYRVSAPSAVAGLPNVTDWNWWWKQLL